MDSPVELTVCQSHAELIGVRSLLESEGVEVAVAGDQHAGTGGMLAAPNPLRVVVAADDLELARELLEELDYAEHLPAEPSSDREEGGRSMEYFRARDEEGSLNDGDGAGGLLRERRRAPLCLFVVAGLFVIVTIQIIVVAGMGRAEPESVGIGFVMLAMIAVLYAGLGVWSFRAPLRAAYTGAVVYGLIVCLVVASDPSFFVAFARILYLVPVALLLWRAVISARRLRDAAPSAGDRDGSAATPG